MRRVAFALALFAACAAAPLAAQARPAPKPAATAAAKTAKTPALAPHAMVAAANPLAAEAGLKVLRAGGSAVDAAVAVQTVLSLVEPQSSGVGGGAFLVYYDAKTKTTTAYDGREVAPAGATPALFLGADGKPLPFYTAVLSGRSTGVPGAIAMLSMAQKEHGVLPWSSLFGEGERLADDGFKVSPRLAAMIRSAAPQASAPDAVAYFTKPDGTKYAAGDVLKNPAYAATLRKIAAEGPAALLDGPIAQAIVDRLHQGDLPSTMTLADLKAYQPHKAAALCSPYRVYVVCAPQPPSGGVGLLEALGVLEHTDIDKRNAGDPQAWFQFAQASRLAYADRDHYVGDPAFVAVPTAGLLDPAYVEARAKLIGDKAGPAPAPGQPKGAPAVGKDATKEPGGTTHFVIVDTHGNVVSMTTTVESIFGSGRMVGGFFLNNQLTDFSFSPTEADGQPAANAVAGGKRPRSTMAPTIVLDRKGDFVEAVGSPGGTSIIAYNLKALVATLDWKMSMQDAVALPNLIAKGDWFVGDSTQFPPQVAKGLAERGVNLKPNPNEASGLHGIVKHPNGYEGGADPRREGVAIGF